ncbi:MAG: cysteine-rich CWC family protein [Rhodoferax sp.]
MQQTAMPEQTSSTTTQALDTGICPLCGQSNQCANEVERVTGVPQGPCWCTTATFDATLLARVPAQARRLACICARCAAPYPIAQDFT